MIDLDDPGAVAAADPSGMLRAILGFGQQARTGYDIGRSLSPVPDAVDVASITMCGMGGSGVAGDVIRALYRERATVPFDIVKDSTLPEHCGRDALVVCSSFSGTTAETLACFEQAVDRGCRTIAVSSGGELAVRAAEGGVPLVRIPDSPPAPRAALGLLLLGTLGALESTGLVPPVSEEVDDAAVTADELAARLAPDVPEPDNEAKAVARWIGGRMPVVWGAEGLGAVAAVRWKTELNENAKVPAFAAALPELDHNEIVGWSEGTGAAFALLALRHHGEHPDVAARFAASMEIAAEAGLSSREVWARGTTPLAGALALVVLGGAASVYLGMARGFDPAPIVAIDRLKRALAEGS